MKAKTALFIVSIAVTYVLLITGCIKEPTACFTVAKTHIGLGDTLVFINCSSDAKSYEWNFGDGQSSPEISPSHIYNDIGEFTVTLTAYSKGEKKEDKVSLTINVTGGACFTVSSHSVYTGDTVYFTNCSTMSESYNWDFGDGTSSTDSVPIHAYQATGNYTVILTATMLNGSVSTATDEITVLLAPVYACFTYLPSQPESGQTVSFTNCSTGASLYLWNFGDGATTDAKNPQHVYLTHGSYTITLTASNPYGNSDVETLTITVVAPSNPFIGTFEATLVAGATLFDQEQNYGPYYLTITSSSKSNEVVITSIYGDFYSTEVTSTTAITGGSSLSIPAQYYLQLTLNLFGYPVNYDTNILDSSGSISGDYLTLNTTLQIGPQILNYTRTIDITAIKVYGAK
jgi:PKD repeat protein